MTHRIAVAAGQGVRGAATERKWDVVGEDTGRARASGQEASGRWAGLVCLSVGAAMLFVNTAAVNVALPDVSASLNASMAQQQWVASAYSLAFVVVLLLAGFGGDRLGHRRVLLMGLVGLLVGSVLGTASPVVGCLIAARALMGAGAGMFVPMSLALIADLFPRMADRARALTVWTIAGTLGAPLGPVIGGGLTSLAGWRAIFAFDVVAFLVVMVWSLRVIPRSRRPVASATGLPWRGGLLVTAGLGLLTAGLINVQRAWMSLSACGSALAGVVLVVLFVVSDLRTGRPLTDLRLFASAPFAIGGIVLATVNFAVFGLIFVLPAYLETVLGHNALVGGLLLMPLVAGAILGSLLNERATRRLSPAGACSAGLTLLALGAVIMGAATVRGGLVLMGVGEALAGLGMGVCQPVALSWGLSQVDSDRRGTGSSLLSVLQQLGSVLGIGVLGTVEGSIYSTGLTASGVHATPEATSSVTIAFQQAARSPDAVGQALREAAARAYTTATDFSLLTCCLVAVGALTAVMVLVHRGDARTGPIM